MNQFKYIIIEGLIKSGKTLLSTRMAELFNYRLIIDNKENPYIDDFHRSISKPNNSSALKTQLIFLLNRNSQQLEIKQKGLFQQTTISDYFFFKDAIYAHATLEEEDLKIYKKIFENFSKNLMQPDIIVYLQISFKEMLRRIKEYGTDAEKEVPETYWRDIFEAYNYYFFNYRQTPIIIVNTENIDFENNEKLERLFSEILNHKQGVKYYAQG